MKQKLFKHFHPYSPFLFPETTKLIVGTLPPPRFTTKELKEGDVDFCYGSRDGQLWPILNKIFELNLNFETTSEAVAERKKFLRNRNIGICDIVESAEREKVDASDLGMQNVQLRNILKYLQEYPKIHTLLFTGGNSKNGPEYFFRRQLKENGLYLEVISNIVPRIHQFNFSDFSEIRFQGNLPRIIKTVSLTAPSGAANRAIGSLESYKTLKQSNPNFTTFDFRVLQYERFF